MPASFFHSCQVFDSGKLFEWNWWIPQFHKRLHVLILIIHIPHEAQHIVALLFPVSWVNGN